MILNKGMKFQNDALDKYNYSYATKIAIDNAEKIQNYQSKRELQL